MGLYLAKHICLAKFDTKIALAHRCVTPLLLLAGHRRHLQHCMVRHHRHLLLRRRGCLAWSRCHRRWCCWCLRLCLRTLASWHHYRHCYRCSCWLRCRDDLPSCLAVRVYVALC